MSGRGSAPSSRTLVALSGVLFTLVVLWSLFSSFNAIRQHTSLLALKEAQTLYDLNLAYRRWSTQYGGVYVQLTDKVLPNPFLASYPRRDLVATDGTKLTLVNPAMMTRQANTLLDRISSRPIQNKLTSLEFLNPQNAPDTWEVAAMQAFEAGKTEVSGLESSGGQTFMRLIKPLVTEQGCIPCHAAQDYRLGDVRGALSISVPMDSYLDHMAQQRATAFRAHLLIWLFGLSGIAAVGLLVRRAERTTAREKEFTETAINAMPGVFSVQDQAGRSLRWNRIVADLRGEAEPPQERLFSQIVHPEDQGMFTAAVAAARQGGSAEVDVRLVPRGGGTARHYLLTARSISIDGLPYLVVSGTDITARRGMEEELRTAAVEWAATFDAINDSILILGPDNRILRCNAAAARFFGLPQEQLVGQSSCGLMHDGVIPEDCVVTRAFASRKPESGVFEARGRNCLVTADPILGSDGEVRKIVQSVHDVTEQRRLEQQLLQAQKMEAVGTLAGGVAHDFNNVLSAILGCASLLELGIPPGDPRRQHVDSILASTKRATQLTRSLLSFGRKQLAELKPVQLNEIVSGFQEFLKRLIGEDIAFTLACYPGDLVVEADRGQLEQVLMNLVTNARDAMPHGGRLQVQTERVEFDRASGGVSAGAYAVLSVSDNGVGMSAQTKEHLFEPFFTTKEVGKGTGLGLAIAYGIVHKHNGAIHVYSERGLGTTFKVFLPLYTGVVGADEMPRVPELLPRGSGTILLVEDDQQTRDVARILLEECGYTVLAAVDGEDAVRVFKEHADRIQLLLSDLIMPKMSGREAFEQMRQLRPALKAIFMSGYPPDIIAEKGLLEHGVPFITKPLNPDVLFQMIRTVLGS